ncbi:uncharacterized protein MEPE_02135 [Melanopsichium pennsylvanicum]|uniref:DEK-C domain-containing protein n=2 Tax=Melanopsichium pennsylvanicum TaxID=63383 RepID=A0AAJ5C4D2_9BASI|nr:uncharacterized protein BN887_05327 [Melanopsichium pennsylvanicum 4]SNX83428.1 uncharacterized protein MEPE_02135 [Melanopsichium pennsylvanicum]
MSLPSDAEMVKHIHKIIADAYDDGTLAQHSKRKVRDMLTDHFGVNLESKKKFISTITQENVNLIEQSRAQESASSSRSPSPVKQAKKKAPAKQRAAVKPKAFSPDIEDDVEEIDGEVVSKADSTAAGGSFASSDVEGQEEFSELEEDTSVSRSRRTAKPKASSSTSKATKKAITPRASAGGSEAEQRLTRLKKLVIECGVRKPWKRLYEAAGISDTDYSAQCKVVQDVLRDLGMTGKGSIEQARKIRQEREFNDELAALQENKLIDDDDDTAGTCGRRTRGSTSARGGVAKRRVIVVDVSDDGSDSEEQSDFEAQDKKLAKKGKIARSTNASKRFNSDSDDQDRKDKGTTRRKSFKSSIASFAADLNSGSD